MPPPLAAEPVVLLATKDLLAVHKPAGWIVHPVGTSAPDLLAWAAAKGLGRLRPAHRLDLDTSGVVIFGCTRERTAALGAAITEGTVRKDYLALCFDVPEPSSGVFEQPLADARRGRPLPARTRYVLAEAIGRFGLLRLSPETGRKHQLRRHLAEAGHPIVGDVLYGTRPFRKVPAFPGRLWLHAWRLTLPEGPRIEAPIPPELTAHLAVLRGT